MIKIKRNGPNENRATYVERTKPTPGQIIQMREKITAMIDFAGGWKQLAEEINIPMHTIKSWRVRGRIPQYVAADIHQIARFRDAGFTREALRPDVSDWGKWYGE